jgi:hypothetical protein
MTSSSLYAQTDTLSIRLNSTDSASIDSIVHTFNTADIDSATTYSILQLVNDSTSGLDSISGNRDEIRNVFSKRFDLEETSSFGIDIRTNIPVAIVSIPNVFFTEGNIRAHNQSQGDGMTDSSTSEITVPLSFGVSFKYYLNANLAVAFSFDKGSLTGMQTNVNTRLSNNVNDYKAFVNHFKVYGANLEMNPVGMFSKNENSSAFKPWVTLGFGYVDSDVKAYRCDGKIKAYQFVCFATTVGIRLSYAVSPSCDLTCGSTLYMVETAYLDGIYNDHKRNDKMLLNAVGITYKFSVSSHRDVSF